MVTITSGSDKLSQKVEENVSPSSRRFDIIREMRSRGIKSGVVMNPLLPYIQDNVDNIQGIIDGAIKSNAGFIYPCFGVTLRGIQRVHYYNKLDINFPGIKDKYIETYGYKYNCVSKDRDSLKDYFVSECNKNNIYYKMRDIIGYYKTQNKDIYKGQQMSIFD